MIHSSCRCRPGSNWPIRGPGRGCIPPGAWTRERGLTRHVEVGALAGCLSAAVLSNVARVQAALLRRRVLPPPTALTLLLVWQDGASAGLAADGHVATLVQLVGWHIHDAQEVPDLGGAHVGEWVVLDEGVLSVDALEDGVRLDSWHGHTGARRLVLALPGDPGLESLELLAEGSNLADPVWQLGVRSQLRMAPVTCGPPQCVQQDGGLAGGRVSVVIRGNLQHSWWPSS